MNVVVNYLFVLLYYIIGCIIGLKYLVLFIINKCTQKQKIVSEEVLEEPKCLQDSRFDTRETSLKIGDKDIQIKYVCSGSPKNPLILFLHGFPEFWYIWKYQMIEFSGDYCTVALEIKGDDKALSDRSFLVECIKAFLDSLGRTRCVMIGRDVGGSLLWSFLDKYPERVTKAVVINAPHPVAVKKELNTLSQVLKSSNVMFYLLPKLPEFSFSKNNYQKLESLFKSAEICQDDLKAYKYYFEKNNGENLTKCLNFYRSNFIADSIFRNHSKTSSEDSSYPQCLIIYTKPNQNYTEQCFTQNYVKEHMLCTEIQTKHGHYFQVNETSSKLLNVIIKQYFENPTKWENEWSDEKVINGYIIKQNFDEDDEKEEAGKKDVDEVYDNLIKKCKETIEHIKEDLKEVEEKKNE